MNYPQQSAQGLASLGRGNDSMLVHMTPREVQGLQGLAMAHGGSLSINPQTGLPEAGILDFVLPVAASYFGVPPWLTASLMAGKTLIEGGDLGEAAMSGLTSYGGAKIGEGLQSFVNPVQQSTTAALNAAKTAGDFVGATGETGSKLLSQSGGVNTLADSLKSSFTPDLVQGFADNNLQGSFMGKDVGAQGMFQPGGGNTLGATGTPTYGANVGAGTDTSMFSDITDKATKLPDQFGAAVKNPVDFARHIGEGNALTGGAKIAMYGASPFVGDILKPEEYAGYEDPEKGKWTSDTGGLSFNPKYSTGLTLLPNLNQPIRAAEGGAISSYAAGGNVTTSGLQSLYAATDSPTNPQLSRDGYGIGRLDNLARQQAMTQAQTTGYADGGYLDGQGDGMSDSIPATIEGKQPARLADGEFVVPADVVSHLGNGSSKAGSKRLYAMLDKVRHARTGNKKQGREIKAEKYVPKVA